MFVIHREQEMTSSKIADKICEAVEPFKQLNIYLELASLRKTKAMTIANSLNVIMKEKHILEKSINEYWV